MPPRPLECDFATWVLNNILAVANFFIWTGTSEAAVDSTVYIKMNITHTSLKVYL